MIVKKIEDLPCGAGEVAPAQPAVWQAFVVLGKATAEAGPLRITAGSVPRPVASPSHQGSSYPGTLPVAR